jgi:hypothetical protein
MTLQQKLALRENKRMNFNIPAGEVPSDTRDHIHADEVVVLTGECTNTMQTCNLLSE